MDRRLERLVEIRGLITGDRASENRLPHTLYTHRKDKDLRKKR